MKKSREISTDFFYKLENEFYEQKYFIKEIQNNKTYMQFKTLNCIEIIEQLKNKLIEFNINEKKSFNNY